MSHPEKLKEQTEAVYVTEAAQTTHQAFNLADDSRAIRGRVG
jgi:hypothetical protein